MQGKLYMIPNTLGESPIEFNLPADNIALIKSLKYFIVENERTARRFLKRVDKDIVIDDLTFFILDKYTRRDDLPRYLNPIKLGNSIGILSEAGCPGVADPGADVVRLAHEKGIRIMPLIGPSSILLSLMASGMNGQSFTFHGYLPLKKGETAKTIKHVEEISINKNQTQIFIEAPFRNGRLLEDLVNSCKPSTRLCVACDITLDTEFIRTKTIAQWKGKLPNIHKRPTIFLLQGEGERQRFKKKR
ncbi:SAM-dependent methyltransferase [Marinilabiliaceae bacterium JC017]|nr:SAM-dependent methyltransferase [Marinilabiliaceae bacterium JC017]